MSCKESFYYQTRFFAGRGYRCIAPDFPGFGGSFPLTSAYSVEDYALWLEKFMRAEGAEGAHAVAHSFGARVAFKLFSSRPQLAKRLVITGGAGLVKERSPRYIRRVKAYRFIKRFAPRYAEKHFGSEEYRSLPPLQKESYKKIVNEDLRGCARAITNRTLLIYGADDKVTPYGEEGEIFHSLIAGSRLEKIAGGHFCFAENYQAFNGLVLGFLSES